MFIKKYNYLLVLALLLIVSMSGFSSTQTGEAHKHLPAGCPGEVSPDCGWAVTPAFDHQNRLWLVFVSGQHIYITQRLADGKFLPAIKVNSQPEDIYSDGENRPKIAMAPNDNIYVSWTQKTPAKFSGDVRFSRSLDGGASFERPRTINDDGLLTSHRFDEMQVTADGNIFLFWIDKRDKIAAEKKQESYDGAAIYYALSLDEGAHFLPNKKVGDYSCECCRLAVAATTQNEVVLFWRQLFLSDTSPAIRDHALATLTAGKPNASVDRATWDNWSIDACPHHGPDLNIDDKQNRHLVWFTSSDTRKGIYYKKISSALPIEGSKPEAMRVDASAGASHPQVVSAGERVVIAWKRFDGEKTYLIWLDSENGGDSWSNEKIAAVTTGDSDHPLLIENGNQVFVSWLTKEQGYRLIAL